MIKGGLKIEGCKTEGVLYMCWVYMYITRLCITVVY